MVILSYKRLFSQNDQSTFQQKFTELSCEDVCMCVRIQAPVHMHVAVNIPRNGYQNQVKGRRKQLSLQIIGSYLSQFELLWQNTTNWVACKQQKCISHHSGTWESEIRVPALLGSDESPLPGCRLRVFTW